MGWGLLNFQFLWVKKGATALVILYATNVLAKVVPIPHGTLEMVSEELWAAPGHVFYLGLDFQLERGWHIYWVNPGDSGQPSTVQWQFPAGFSAGPIEWPIPQRFSESSSIADFGYESNVMLMAPVYVDAGLDVKQPFSLGAKLKLLVCNGEACLPGEVYLSLSIPAKKLKPVPDSIMAERFAIARKKLPLILPDNWKIKVADMDIFFVLTADTGRQEKEAFFFPLVESQISNSESQKLEPMDQGFRLSLKKSNLLDKKIERLKGLVVLSQNRSYLIDAVIGKHGSIQSKP